jgi:hypothetical protein
MNSASIVSGYQDYLDKTPWDVYLTVTFRGAGVDSAEALRRFRKFMKRLNSSKDEFFKKFARGFAVTERQGREESVHIHCLLNGIPAEKVPLLGRRCTDVFGMSKAEVYDYGLPRTASHYIAEKCAKGTAEDWTFLHINSIRRGRRK